MNITELARRYAIAKHQGWATESELTQDSFMLTFEQLEQLAMLRASNSTRWIAECLTREAELNEFLKSHGMSLTEADEIAAQYPTRDGRCSESDMLYWDEASNNVRKKEWSIKYSEEWPPYQ